MSRLHSRLVLAMVPGVAALVACADADADADERVDPVPVVVDYSPTLSDVTALLYLAGNPAVDLRAVTLAGTGESHCAAAVANTKGVLALTGDEDVPVACGPSEPLGLGRAWPEDWREAADDLPGLSLTPVPGEPPGTDAVELLTSTAADADGLRIVALAPLTNLATAIRRDPAFVDDVAMVYTMGGAFDVAGNAPDGTTEWNYAVDPPAVAAVVGSGIPLTVVPLDATDHVPMSKSWFAQLAERRSTTAAADAVFDLQRTQRPWDNGFFFWDELTAAIAVDETLATFDESAVQVETAGLNAGRTVRGGPGATVRIAGTPDVERFERELLAGLTGED